MRNKFTKVKTAKGRKTSSTQWLQRQLNDPFVAQARASGYRSRAAFKLLEIQDKFQIFKPGQYVIDLGAAPGGWSQIAAELIKSKTEKPHIVGIDLLEMDAVPGATFIQKNFYDEDIEEVLASAIGVSKVDIVMSDMAANTTGHARTDHLRIMDLCHHAFLFARKFLNPGGSFIAKIFQGGAEKEVLDEIKRSFVEIKHFKPKSSRQDSAEMYLVAKGFK
jgi:23S rRNA (uridine2552-2'-O)-methyltransferase